MTFYKHILLAADLVEPEGHPVIEKAVGLAQLTKAKLSIVHVIETPYTYGMPPYEIPVDWQTELEEAVRANFLKLGKKLNIPLEDCHLLKGQAKSQILDLSQRIQADLIIVGSHGKHGLGLFLMGSTANGVLHGALCDVLAVRIK